MKVGIALIEAAVVIAVAAGHTGRAYAEDSNAVAGMKVLWEKEIAPDVNLSCSVGPVALDRVSNRLLIGGTSFWPKTYSDGKLWVVEVNADSGNMERTVLFRNIREGRAKALLLLSSLTVCDGNEAVLTGRVDGLASPISIMRISRKGGGNRSIEVVGAEEAEKKNRKRREGSLIIQGAMSIRGGDLLLIGSERKGAFVMRTDSEGDVRWKRNYRVGEGEMTLFSDAVAAGDEGEFAAAGISANSASSASRRSPFPDLKGEGFIVRCNSRGEIMTKDVFSGGNPWPGQLPKICRTDGGSFVIVYGRSWESEGSEIRVRGYSSDLKFLWEKTVVKSEANRPSCFAAAATANNGFVAAANVDIGNLRVYQYDERGKLIAGFSMDDEVWLFGMGAACAERKVLVVYQSKPNSVKGEELSRIKIVALELK